MLVVGVHRGPFRLAQNSARCPDILNLDIHLTLPVQGFIFGYPTEDLSPVKSTTPGFQSSWATKHNEPCCCPYRQVPLGREEEDFSQDQ